MIFGVNIEVWVNIYDSKFGWIFNDMANKMNLTGKKQAAVYAAAFWRNGTSFRFFWSPTTYTLAKDHHLTRVFFEPFSELGLKKNLPFFVSKCQLVFGRTCFFFFQLRWFFFQIFFSLKKHGLGFEEKGPSGRCRLFDYRMNNYPCIAGFFHQPYTIHHRMQVSFLFGSVVLREGP